MPASGSAESATGEKQKPQRKPTGVPNKSIYVDDEEEDKVEKVEKVEEEEDEETVAQMKARKEREKAKVRRICSVLPANDGAK